MSAVAGDLPPGTTVGIDPLAADAPRVGIEEADAAVRLAESRERLRRAMLGPPPAERAARAARTPRSPGAASPSFGASSIATTLRRLLDRVRSLPAAEVLIDAVETWWAAHPLHTAGSMAADASKAYVQPIARRNPVAFVAGSAVVGALFFLTRPWRWALRPVLLAGLLPQIVSHALRRAPVGSWLNIATAFAKAQSSAAPRRASPPRPSPAPAAGSPGPVDAGAFVRPAAAHERAREPTRDPGRD